MKDYYKILELEKTANLTDIKKSFRKLSKVLHPDKETGDKDKFQDLNEAYQTLSDSNKRRAYDTGATYRPPQQPIINNIGIRILWTLNDVKKGKKVQITVQRIVICKTCNGMGSLIPTAITTCHHCQGAGRFSRQEHTPFGSMMMEQTCMHCRGTGELNTTPCPNCRGEKMVNENIKETIEIPLNTIFPFTITGKGHKTIHGDSDLVIYFDFQDPSGVRFLSNEFSQVITVDFFDALLGKEQVIKFGDTTLKVTLPKESKTDQSLRLNKAYCGFDVLFHIKVIPPTIKQIQEYVLNLFKEDKEILPIVTKRINESLK